MARNAAQPSREILEAALHGLEAQKQKLDEQIAEVRSMLGRRVGRPPRDGVERAGSGAKAPRKARAKRTLSAEARKRIAAAQKKRWASFRKTQG